jgi:hypothetical protein
MIGRLRRRAGIASTSSPDDAGDALNEAIVWYWRARVSSNQGYAERTTEILTTASVDTVSILAGQGGASGSTPIVRGVFRLLGLYRPLAAGSLNRYPVRHYQQSNYYDFAAPLLDEERRIPLPGIYWYEQSEDGVIDALRLRPVPDSVEQLRLVYLPPAPQLVADTDTLELGNDDESVLYDRAAYLLLRPQDASRSAEFKAAADEALRTHVKAYNSRRDGNGPDRVSNHSRDRSSVWWPGMR